VLLVLVLGVLVINVSDVYEIKQDAQPMSQTQVDRST
jgi:hypothetical protein